MISIAQEIFNERKAQHKKWGEQNHPDGTSADWAPKADFHKRECNIATEEGKLTWRHILREEVYEAFAEADVDTLRAELIQIAAVTVAWIEAIDRRADGKG